MQDKIITLAHGSGGAKMRSLIKDLFLKHLGNPYLNSLADAAVLKGTSRFFKNKNAIKKSACPPFAFTTDSYVVSPIFFPGGDIGKLSICGTVNDLAVMGARPLYISCGVIIEEGLPLYMLEKITISIAQACKKAKVKIVTGDVKVVEKGSADKIFINTSGVGVVKYKLEPDKIKPGDCIIINGTIAEHGFTILSARKNLEFKSNLKSDCASLNDLISKALKASKNIRFMRDATRGGLAGVLTEIVEGKNFGAKIEEAKIPLKPQVKALSEILGIDPLYMANEGKVVIIAPEKGASKVVNALKRHPLGKQARIIGEIIRSPRQKVILKSRIGGSRLIEPPASAQIPRIC